MLMCYVRLGALCYFFANRPILHIVVPIFGDLIFVVVCQLTFYLVFTLSRRVIRIKNAGCSVMQNETLSFAQIRCS